MFFFFYIVELRFLPDLYKTRDFLIKQDRIHI